MGNDHIWAAIYRQHSAFVYRVLLGRVRHHADAEDLTAEVFMRALRALRPLGVAASEPEIRGYLLATVRTVLADHWRRSSVWRTAELRDDIAEPPRAADAAESGKAQAVLARLPERYRQILELRFLRAHSLREAADELGISIGNAKVLQHRALSRAAQLAGS